MYFVPLSNQLARFTLGDSSAFNYVVHVNQANPDRYFQIRVTAAGERQHQPERDFPMFRAAYSFPYRSSSRHPLRFVPAYWNRGLRPRFPGTRRDRGHYPKSEDLLTCPPKAWEA